MSVFRGPKVGRERPPLRHTRGRLWSNSLVRAFLATWLLYLPTYLPLREATRKNALIASMHLISTRSRGRGGTNLRVLPSPFHKQSLCVYLFPPSAFLMHFLPHIGEERKIRTDRVQKETRQMSISTMHRRWEGGNKGVINCRSSERFFASFFSLFHHFTNFSRFFSYCN